MKKLLGAFGFLLAGGLVFPMTATQAEAGPECGCRVKWSKCIAEHFKPGQSAGAAARCDAKYDTCAGACSDKKACVKDCREMKKAAKTLCVETFRDSACPIRGKARRKCVQEAKKDRNECLKAAQKNCVKTCK